ncbi:MAG: restriction endonuclease subunit S [Christensenellaceae bacterium]|jgi:type I restriction enzyme S subunit|nr:restriction endonuclease subunit S [Christensenellaceae bacterium]
MAEQKENKSIDELLLDAIICDEKVPYEIPDNWVWTKLKNVSQVISKGTTPAGGKSAYLSSGIKFLRVENINEFGQISNDKGYYIAKETHLNELKRSVLEEYDVLITIAGTLGKTGYVLGKDLPLNANQAVAFIRLIENLKPYFKFYELLLRSPLINFSLVKQAKITAIPNLTLEIVRECIIPLPPLAEQERIVKRIESLFEKLDKAKELIDCFDQIETMKKTILAKAFRGQFDTNDPTDEPASKLLKRILEEKYSQRC